MNARAIRRKATYTPRAVRQALEIMARIAEPTPRERAEERIRKAKVQLSTAAEAAIRGDSDAVLKGTAATTEHDAARCALRALDWSESHG
jgi:hypothetical protein